MVRWYGRTQIDRRRTTNNRKFTASNIKRSHKIFLSLLTVGGKIILSSGAVRHNLASRR